MNVQGTFMECENTGLYGLTYCIESIYRKNAVIAMQACLDKTSLNLYEKI